MQQLEETISPSLPPARLTAFPAFVREVLSGSFVRGDFESGQAAFVESGGGRFSRVCLYGRLDSEPALSNGLREFAFFDGTGTLPVRAPAGGCLDGFNKADEVFLIGRIRESQERFLFVEAASKSTDNEWRTVHALRVRLHHLTKS